MKIVLEKLSIIMKTPIKIIYFKVYYKNNYLNHLYRILYLIIMKYLLPCLLIVAVVTIAPRQQAPDFTVQAVMPDNSFATLKLSDYIGKYVVLLFYPFDFTYVCPTEIISYSEKA